MVNVKNDKIQRHPNFREHTENECVISWLYENGNAIYSDFGYFEQHNENEHSLNCVSSSDTNHSLKVGHLPIGTWRAIKDLIAKSRAVLQEAVTLVDAGTLAKITWQRREFGILKTSAASRSSTGIDLTITYWLHSQVLVGGWPE